MSLAEALKQLRDVLKQLLLRQFYKQEESES